MRALDKLGLDAQTDKDCYYLGSYRSQKTLFEFLPVQEAHVGEETVLILRVAELSKELLDILLGDLVSEIAQDVVKLSQHHGAVAVFVVELEELEVVGVSSLGVGGGDGGLDLLDNIVILGELLALLVSLSLGNAGLEIHDSY